MNCTKCNTPNTPEARFCKNCGANIISTPEIQTKTDDQAIKSLLIILGIDYLLSMVMFIIQKVIIPSIDNDSNQIGQIFDVYGWVSDIVTLGVMLFFLVTIKHETVKKALIVFIILRFIFMIGYKVFPLSFL